MTAHPEAWINQHHESPYAVIKRTLTPLPTITPHNDDSETSPLLHALSKDTLVKPLTFFERAAKWLGRAINPPLQGGLAAMAVGVIGPVRRVVFEQGWGGWVDPLTQSISKMGGLFTVLQMCVPSLYLSSFSRSVC